MARDPRLPSDAEAFEQGAWVSSNCPPVDLVQASEMDVLPATLQAAVAAHVASCMVCQSLVQALDDPSVSQMTADEQGRIASRVRAGRGSETNATRHRLARWTAAGALLAAGLVLLVQLRQSSPPVDDPTRTIPELALRKPELSPAGGDLVWRGGDPGAADQLARALEPYRQDDYSEAVRTLQAFTSRHPASAAGHFYLGVSRLFAGSVAEAIANLEEADRLAKNDDALSNDTSWYLALAYLRAGHPDRGVARLSATCSGSSARAANACAALAALKTKP